MRYALILAFAMIVAGCASPSSPAETPTRQPAAPGDSDTTALVEGQFSRAAVVSAAGESQHVSDGEDRFDIPSGTVSIAFTLSWSSPIGAQYRARLGQEGGYLGEEVAGASPLIIAATDDVRVGETQILVWPSGEAGAIPHQEFQWEAEFTIHTG